MSYDPGKTYAQMMRPETVKILLVIALHVHRGWAGFSTGSGFESRSPQKGAAKNGGMREKRYRQTPL